MVRGKGRRAARSVAAQSSGEQPTPRPNTGRRDRAGSTPNADTLADQSVRSPGHRDQPSFGSPLEINSSIVAMARYLISTLDPVN